MNLYYRETGQGEPLIILHGLFGAGDNWLSVARLLEQEYRVILPDARNHGQSPHSHDFDYPSMAQDLAELLDTLGLEQVLLAGHSMGGKAAMQFAVTYPQKVKKLAVVDIAPRYYSPHHQTILEAFSSLPLQSLKSRSEADQGMAQHIKDIGTRQFLLKNLSRTEDGFAWKINLPVIAEKIENIGVPLTQGSSYGGPTLFIGGSNSNYIRPEDHAKIKEHFPKARIEMVAGAGHWVHAEKPEAVVNLLKSLFNENG